MSYDITYWKRGKRCKLTDLQIYESLSAGERVAGLLKLPSKKILQALVARYPDFKPTEKFPLIPTANGSIEPSWDDYHLRFDFRGDALFNHAPAIEELMARFDCPPFDPNYPDGYTDEDRRSEAAFRDLVEAIDQPPQPPGSTDRKTRLFRLKLGLSDDECVAVAPKAADVRQLIGDLDWNEVGGFCIQRWEPPRESLTAFGALPSANDPDWDCITLVHLDAKDHRLEYEAQSIEEIQEVALAYLRNGPGWRTLVKWNAR